MKLRKKALPEPLVVHYVESFFEEIRYSKEISEAKNQIIEALNQEYLESKEQSKQNAFESLVEKYPTLQSMAARVGKDSNEVNDWINREVSLSWEGFQEKFKKERRHIYLAAFLIVAALYYLVNTILFFRVGFLFNLIALLVFSGLALLVVLRHRRGEKATFSVDHHTDLENLFDRYTRRSAAWMLLLFLLCFIMVSDYLRLLVNNSKADELIESFSRSFAFITVTVFFFLKNLLIVKWLCANNDFEKEPRFRRSMRTAAILSLVYWAAGMALYYVFEKVLVLNISVFIIIGYLLFMLIYFFGYTKKFTYSGRGARLTTKIALITLLIVGLVGGGYLFLSRNIWLTQPYINSVPYIYEGNDTIEYDEKTGIFTITSDKDDFRILQLTDIHIGGSVLSYDKDLKALKACYALIEAAKPDLVVVTGDMAFPMGVMSFSFNNMVPVQQFAAFMRNTGVPWIFTYGNHDTENISFFNQEALNDLYQSLSWNTSKNLLYPYTQPEIWGRNNQLVEVRNSDGTLNQALFLIDSNAYTGDGLNKYDYIHDDQVNWYRSQIERLNAEEGHTISSLVFFHIPLQQYRTAYELYEAGSSEITYYFGSNDEKMINKICCSDFPSAIFDTAVELGSTKGFFCGHDHYNNMSLEYQGIRLTYGMSIDYLVMPGIARDTAQRGGTLIVSHYDGSVEIEQIPLTSLNTAN